MDMILTRDPNGFLITGIFGRLESLDKSFACFTLEHSYNCVPKIANGYYKCVRGFHKLEGAVMPIETFQLTNVQGATGILIHPGNFNKDSEGCILLGLTRPNDEEILSSRAAFEQFMKLQEGQDSFTLTVK